MWIFCSFLTAGSETAKDIVSKTGSAKINEFVMAFSLQFFSSIFLLPIVIFTGIPLLTWHYYVSILLAIVLMPLWSILYMKAVKYSALSLVVPILAFNLIFTLILALFFEGKIPNLFGLLGVLSVTLGTYLLRIKTSDRKLDVLAPIRSLFHDQGSLCMLGVALIWSFGAYINKLGIKGSSPVFFSFSITAVGAAVLFLIAHRRSKMEIKTIKNNLKTLLPLGFFNGLSELSLMMALSVGFLPFIISIKRGSMLLSFLAGIFIFKEKFHKFSLPAIVLIFSGVLLIIFS